MAFQVLLIILNFISIEPDIDPVREYSMTPESFDLTYEEHIIVTHDSAEIKAWYMPSDSDEKRNVTVLIAGSDAGNMGYTLPYAFHLLRIGFDVVTFDYRGFGGSSAFKHNTNYLYHTEYITDFISTAQWVKNELNAEAFGVMAFSMGTLVATAAYPVCTYDFLIAEGYVITPENIVDRIEAQNGIELELPADHNPGFPDVIEKMDIPMVVFASKQDSVTTLSDSKAITDDRNDRALVPYDGPHLRGMVTLGVEKYLSHIAVMAEQF